MKHHQIVTLFIISIIIFAGCKNSTSKDLQSKAPSLHKDYRRFFNDSSFWNQPIAENAEVDERSKAFIELLKKEPTGNNFGINLIRYTVPVYDVDSTTPKFVVKHTKLTKEDKTNWATKRDFLGHGAEFDAEPIPIPINAIPDSAGDHHMALVDWKNGIVWDMWGCRKLPDGTWQSNTGMKYSLDGAGVFDGKKLGLVNGESVHFHGPSRASGVPLVAGLIMYDEVMSGEIKHKLACAIRFSAHQEFVYPATWTDGYTDGGIPEGSVIQLDPKLDLTRFNLLPGEIVVAKALQKYGMVITDVSGGSTLYGERLDVHGKTWDGILREWKGGINSIPLEHYRVLKIKNSVKMGDNHNYINKPF
jgi:hypothetical protein